MIEREPWKKEKSFAKMNDFAGRRRLFFACVHANLRLMHATFLLTDSDGSCAHKILPISQRSIGHTAQTVCLSPKTKITITQFSNPWNIGANQYKAHFSSHVCALARGYSQTISCIWHTLFPPSFGVKSSSDYLSLQPDTSSSSLNGQ